MFGLKIDGKIARRSPALMLAVGLGLDIVSGLRRAFNERESFYAPTPVSRPVRDGVDSGVRSTGGVSAAADLYGDDFPADEHQPVYGGA